MTSTIKKYPKAYSFCIAFLAFYFFGFLINSNVKLGILYSLTLFLGKISCLIGKLFGSTCLYSSALATVQIGTIVLIILFWLFYFIILRNLKKQFDI